jgi:hypothetical protein
VSEPSFAQNVELRIPIFGLGDDAVGDRQIQIGQVRAV